MSKNLGILAVLVVVFFTFGFLEDRFFLPGNLFNLIRWTALFGILSIGVSFVIITGGIDLSIGSVVGLSATLLPWFLAQHELSAPVALALVVIAALAIGLAHGLLITKLRLQPFVVTLCGLLVYRGLARTLTDDQVQGFGMGHSALRQIAKGMPCSLALLTALVGIGYLMWHSLRWVFPRTWRKGLLKTPGELLAIGCAALLGFGGLLIWALDAGELARIQAPAPFLILVVLAILAGVLLDRTVYGRHLRAFGRNETAARYSGLAVDRNVVIAYVLCALCSALAGVLFALDVNSVQPAIFGNFYELYAIAAAVLGGCSLRGGQGSILGVVVGTAVIQVLRNGISMLGIPDKLEFVILGAVILIGVAADEVIRRLVARRRLDARVRAAANATA
ncbi:MAG: ABC transporter permease [Planctomycetes bacterium]|nr:ABC transporter permease [Planctomycetota bacterium]